MLMTVSAATLTPTFAREFASLSLAQVPNDVREHVKSLIFDTLGCAKAALDVALAPKIKGIASIFGTDGHFSTAGSAAPTALLQAVYANARLANLLDFDETFPVGVHFGVGAVAAALAGVEAGGGTFDELLVATLAGYEAGARLAVAIGPMMKVVNGEVQGFSPVWGVAAPVVLAACVAYAKARNVKADVLHQAVGIAGSNIPLPIGSKWSGAVDLPDVKYCDAGWCAITGVHGVESALAGLTGFDDILEGQYGVPEAYAAVMSDISQMHRPLAEKWLIREITYKPWPTCRFMHAVQTALAKVIASTNLAANEIKQIILYTNPLANSARFRKPSPTTFCGHQFSYAHAVSMMAMRVPPGAQWFDPELVDSDEARAMRAKVSIELYDASRAFAGTMVENQLREMPGAVRVVTQDGTEFFESSAYAAGDPWTEETRYSKRELIDKFIKAVPNSQAFCDEFWGEAGMDVARLTNFLRSNNG